MKVLAIIFACLICAYASMLCIDFIVKLVLRRKERKAFEAQLAANKDFADSVDQADCTDSVDGDGVVD